MKPVANAVEQVTTGSVHFLAKDIESKEEG
jgi:hypothetical protein